MSKAGNSFEQMKTSMLKDEEFRLEYERLQPRYETIQQIIAESLGKNIKVQNNIEGKKSVPTHMRAGTD